MQASNPEPHYHVSLPGKLFQNPRDDFYSSIPEGPEDISEWRDGSLLKTKTLRPLPEFSPQLCHWHVKWSLNQFQVGRRQYPTSCPFQTRT
jgi:hypothetical protein